MNLFSIFFYSIRVDCTLSLISEKECIVRLTYEVSIDKPFPPYVMGEIIHLADVFSRV